jgi:two-component system, OmpR family, sensor kinase
MNLRRLSLPFLPTATLFGQLLALIVLSLLAAVAVNVLVIFNLPPPEPDFYRISEIVEVIRGQPVIGGGADHRPLVSQMSDHPPQLDPNNPRFMFGFRRDLATILGASPDDIVIRSDFFGFPDRRIFQAVRREISRGGGPHTADERYLIAPFELAVKRMDGRWMIIQPKPSLKPTPWQQLTFTWVALSTLALAPIAYLFARRLASPIAQFAAAAERLGRDPHAPPLVIKGPAEIAVAVQAFNDMQERLARYVDDRTAMIGAVAHDLRTPLMRLRFRAEAAPEELRAKISADIAEMEAMISGTMAFVRDASQKATRTRLELSSLLESLADEMNETGQDVVVEQADRIVIHGDPLALRRLFNNLLENAVKFGHLARIRVFTGQGNAVVEIDDQGPGLPTSEMEQVFEPFYRREGSRSRETGGIGLGLAVVRSVARAHGGDAELENRLGGGLTARVHLPLSAAEA